MRAPPRGSPIPRRARQVRHRTPREGRPRPRPRVPRTGRSRRHAAGRWPARPPWPGQARWSRRSQALSGTPRRAIPSRRSWPEILPYYMPPRTFQVRVVRLGEAELAVQAVGVAGVQGPPEARARAAVDHRRHQLLAQAGAARVREDEDIRQVGERHAVRDGAGEADLAAFARLAGMRLVPADDPPRGGELLLEIRPRTEPAPVRLRGQELPHRVPVDPDWIVVKLVHAGGEDHRGIVGAVNWLAPGGRGDGRSPDDSDVDA